MFKIDPTLSLTGRARRRHRSSHPAKSPEFEFWNPSRNPSPTTLLSADELFSGGFLLPLHLLPDHHHLSHPEPKRSPYPESEPAVAPSASIASSSGNPILSASKRWKEIFKMGEKKTMEKSLEKRKERKNSSCNNGSAELSINIWPFSRSRSAGNNSTRSKSAVLTGRKLSSAPCSRNNSSGESKSRRSCPSSPGRSGVYLGRSNPVLQVRKNRTGSDEGSRGKAAAGADAGKGRVLNLNVPMCIGYRQQLSCRSEENATVGGGCSGGDNSGGVRSGGGGCDGGDGYGYGYGNLFSLRGLFSKKSVAIV